MTNNDEIIAEMDLGDMSRQEYEEIVKALDKVRVEGLPSKGNKELLEELAELEHEQWMSWSKSIMQQIMGSAEEFGGRNLEKRVSEKHNALLNCWKPYAELSEDQKEKDRIWARKVIQAARNSAHKELDDLKAEMKELQYHYNAINGVMNETNKEMKRKEAEHQEQVRKLKEFLDERVDYFLKQRNQWKLFSAEYKENDILLAHYVSIGNLVNEIFPDVSGEAKEKKQEVKE